jgi:hypothetical protein
MEGRERAGSTRYLIIVAPGEVELYKYLQQRFRGDKKVEVLLDRRRGERRQDGRAYDPERRRRDRRGPARDGYRSIGLVVIRKRQENASA